MGSNAGAQAAFTPLSRRDFVRASLLAGGSLLAGCSGAPSVARSGSANGDIRVAVVGLRNQGHSHMRTYCDMPGARLVALCDVDSEILASRVDECAKLKLKVAAYRDYRELLEARDIDAVVIATPNHQHSLQAIWALQAGKDVYVEKPLSHNLWESRQVVAAARRYDRNVIMAGIQNRSSLDIQRAVALVRAGTLGRIQWARGLCYKRRDSIGIAAGPQPVPASIDYDLWTGPADLVPPHRNSEANGPVHYDWHWFWNYGGGDIANQGVHQMDVARWLLGEEQLPPTVMSFGGRFGYRDDAETPNTLVSVLNYERAPLIFEVRGLPMKTGMRAMDRYRIAQIGVILQCEEGYVHVSENGTAAVFDNQDRRLEAYTEGGNAAHRANFVKAVQTRKVAQGLVADAHCSTALCHLANISYLLGAERPNPVVAEAVRTSALTGETFSRTLEHLKANAVDTAATPTVLGPLLQIDPVRERISGPSREIVDAAGRLPLYRRAGRAPFVIPTLAA